MRGEQECPECEGEGQVSTVCCEAFDYGFIRGPGACICAPPRRGYHYYRCEECKGEGMVLIEEDDDGDDS